MAAGEPLQAVMAEIRTGGHIGVAVQHGAERRLGRVVVHSPDRAATLTASRIWPRTPVANPAISRCMRSMSCSRRRAWVASALPAGVGCTPLTPRSRRGTPKASSISDMRLLTADGTMFSRAAARARLPSSKADKNNRSDTGSISRGAGGTGRTGFMAGSVPRCPPGEGSGFSRTQDLEPGLQYPVLQLPSAVAGQSGSACVHPRQAGGPGAECARVPQHLGPTGRYRHRRPVHGGGDVHFDLGHLAYLRGSDRRAPARAAAGAGRSDRLAAASLHGRLDQWIPRQTPVETARGEREGAGPGPRPLDMAAHAEVHAEPGAAGSVPPYPASHLRRTGDAQRPGRHACRRQPGAPACGAGGRRQGARSHRHGQVPVLRVRRAGAGAGRRGHRGGRHERGR
ncbi:hypothetical protein G6F31_014207 [Rhizopus arrhizus]|nr:hypothetical protein G6F31_014207 [Rhizopus arrhizus]